MERCRKHFNNQYSSRKILQQAWVATVEVGMATWKAINSLWSTQDPSIQARIDQAFKAKWYHLGIFGVDCATIVWCFLPPLYFLDFFNVWWGCCLPPLLGVFSERGKNIREFCKVIFGTTLISYLVDPLLSPHPQFVDIHKIQKLKKKDLTNH
jgi:hypothetical protein